MLYNSNNKIIKTEMEKFSEELFSKAVESYIRIMSHRPLPWPITLYAANGDPIPIKRGGSTIKFRRYNKLG